MDRRTMLQKALANPGHAWIVALALARGWYYRIKFRLLGRRVLIGRRFRVSGPLDIRGPGTVIFGDDCSVISSRMQPTTPYTHAPDAVIRIGSEVFLNGTRFGCQSSIDVGDFAVLADARIFDTDFHAVESFAGPRKSSRGATKPVVIGRNAWLAAGSMVLKGVTIGENAVIGAGAVVTSDVPANVIAAGNPARVVKRLAPPS